MLGWRNHRKYELNHILISMLVISTEIYLGSNCVFADHDVSHNHDHNSYGILMPEELSDYGIETSMSLTSIYQANVRGGTSTHNKRGRYSGSYDMELSADMQRLIGADNGTLYIHAEGWWSKSSGIDVASVGSVFGVNGDAGTRDAMVVTELWWEQVLLEDTALLRVGKLDITGGFECRGCAASFDGSAYANDETAQFLNRALVNNPGIPFPAYGLGAILHYNGLDWWYASAGVIDARSDSRETGFRTTFHGEDFFFYIFETGLTPQFRSGSGALPGAYRVGFWNDPQPKANSDSVKNYRDDVGIYFSFDQMFHKENTDPEDSQGLGLFARFGYAPGNKNDITNFFSAGLQCQGLLESRDQDVLGIGFARGYFSDTAAVSYPENHESVLEMYYNAVITPGISVSPSLQYVADPGGSGSGTDAVVFGLRAQMTF